MVADDPKAEVGSFDRPVGVRPMSERIAEMYTPPANVTIATQPAPGVMPRPRLRSTARAIGDAHRAEAGELRKWAAELVEARDASNWLRVLNVAIAIGVAAKGLDEMADKCEEDARV